MATIDLGKIKQVFRGTYNNATAYAVDDLVVFTDTGITSTYICTTASTGNNPSSGGTAHANWAYVAKGTADPGIPSQSGNTGKFLKTDGSSLSFAAAGGLLGMNQYHTFDQFSCNPSGTTWANLRTAHKVDYTATSTTSHFLLESFISVGMDAHDTMFTMNWWDSLKGASDGNELFGVGGAMGNRKRGTFAMFAAGAGVNSNWPNFWLEGLYSSVLYYPASGQRSTSARSFYPVIRSNGYDGTMYINYSKQDHVYGFVGSSYIRVTEIEGSIVG